MSDIDTMVTPPEQGADEGEGFNSARITVWFSDVSDRSYDAGITLFDAEATDPAQVADAALRALLALGQLLGSDHHWALMQRLTTYTGGAV